MNSDETVSSRAKLFSLIALSLVATFLWRTEIFLHGWEGLIWIRYFHYAIPCMSLLFLGWLWYFELRFLDKRRWSITFSFACFISAAFAFLYFSLALRFLHGPIAMFLKPWMLFLSMYSLCAYGLILPLSYLFLIRKLIRTPRRAEIILFMLIYLASYPCALWLLAVTRHPGSVDFIHTIKSGFIIPFLFTASGMPFIRSKN
ncbi:MAG: hypothetical protein KDD62_16325 [Bdellovibrionales bacterium]|nr:hypothetical protein [Bdellovibrionales bacterium]